MKTKLLFLIAMMSVFISYGQTNVGGTLTLDTQWTLEGSPYILTSDLEVINGSTLTIEAGVEIQGDFELSIEESNILIEGNETSKVAFSQTLLMIKSINFDNSKISFADFSNDSGIRIRKNLIENTGELVIESSVFTNSFLRAYLGGEATKIILNNCLFNTFTLSSSESGEIEIYNSILNDSEVWFSGAYYLPVSKSINFFESKINSTQFHLGNGQELQVNGCTIEDSIVFNSVGSFNSVYKIYNSYVKNTYTGLGGSKVDIKDSFFYVDIENPTTIEEIINEGKENLGSSYYIYGTNISIENSIFEAKGNFEAINLENINFNSEFVDVVDISIKNVVFKGFKNVLKVADFEVMDVENCDFLEIKENTIINNSTIDIDATENYWGTTDETIIANQIYDGVDNANYGIVNYSNYLTAPTGNAPISEPKNVFKGEKENGIFITWNANEETDLAGYKIYSKVNDLDEYTFLADVGNLTSYTTEEITTGTIIAVKAYNTDADGDNDFITGDESVFSLEAENIFENVSLSSNSICSGETLQMDFDSNYSFSDVNEFTLQISDASGSFETATSIQTISTVEEGFSFTLPETLISGQSYFLRIISTDLAIFSEVFDIVTYDSPDTDFEITTSSCSSDIVTVTYTGASEFYGGEFLWDFNGATIISGEGFGPYELKWQTEGEKTIILDVAENGCSSSNSEIITIKQTPVANFSIQESACGGETIIVEFTETISETAIYSWDFDGATIVSGSNAGPYEINWGDSYGEKNVSLSVTDNGCTSELAEKVTFHHPYLVGTIDLDTQVCSGGTTSVTLIGDFTATTNYTWNFNGGVIVTGNGSGPYEILWDTGGVKNVSVSIEDSACVINLSEEIEVLETPTAGFVVHSTICGQEIVEVSIEEDISETAIYTWNFDDAIIVSGEGAGPYEITWGNSYGEKNITLSVSNNGCTSETNTEIVQYNALPTLFFDAEETICYNEDFTIEYIGENFTDVYWYFGEAEIISGSEAGPYILKWNEPGEKTIFFQANNNGCFVSEEVNVVVLPELTTPDMCIVTVDEKTSKNKLIWDYNLENLSQFGIYKETNVSGDYELVSYVDDTVSEFIDIDSSPAQRSNRYKISALDICGSETELSEYQKTIHLTISKGTGDTWNLIWDNYEGVDFSTYKIYRDIDNTGFELLTEISNNLNSFTDIDVTTDNVSYVIEVVSSESCGGQLANKNVSAKQANNLLSARSNIASSDTALSIENVIYNELQVYPNPASDFIKVDLNSYDLLSYELLSVLGQSIKKGSFNEGNQINVRGLSKGQYLLRISTEKGDIIKNVIKM